MTEEEYIKLSNLTHLRSALHHVGLVFGTEHKLLTGMSIEEKQKVSHIIVEAIVHLEKEQEIE